MSASSLDLANPHGYLGAHAADGGVVVRALRPGARSVRVYPAGIELEVPEAELGARRKAWRAPPLKATRGTLFKHIKSVKSASEGCVTDE